MKLRTIQYGSIIISLWTMLISSTAVLAAPTNPGTISRQLEQSEQYREQQQQIEKEQGKSPEIDVDKLLGGKKKSTNSTVKFKLNNVEVNDSDILTSEELDVIFQRYIGRIITLNDLNKLLGEINSLYKLKGYLASKALLPPQKIKDGIVQIRLIEGRVGKLELNGNKSTNNAYILDRLDLSKDDLVDLKTLEQHLERLNLLNDIQVGIALKPGERVGKTDYLLTVKEPKRHESFVYMDNAGTKDVGLYRFGFNYIDRSLTGNRDLLTIGGYAARGTEAFYTSYKFPINKLGTTLNLSGNVSSIEIVEGPIKPLDITGDAYTLGIGISHPLIVTPDNLLTANIGINKKRSATASSGVKLFKTYVHTAEFGFTRQSFSPDSVSFASLKGTTAPSGWDNSKSFFKINADFSYNKKLNDWLALLRIGGQWSDTKLLPSTEQFQVGGIYTVRGYPEGLLIGDKGYYSSIELSHTIPDEIKSLLGQKARYSLFLDHGAAIPVKGNGEGTNRDDFLTSIGIGLDFNLSKVISAHIIAAKPLMKRSDNNDSGRVNFNIQARF